MKNTNSKKQERVILNKAGRPYNEFELEVKKAGRLVLNDRYLFEWDDENDSIVFLNSLKEEKSNKNYAVKSLKEERSISPEDKAPEDKTPEPPKQEPKEDIRECYIDLGEGLVKWDGKEYWKQIEGYDNKYMISTFGRVWNIIKDKEVARVKDSDGYLRVNLLDRNKKGFKRVHRLVAHAFILNENPETNKYINHIDEIKTNCRVDNLEYCDIAYNNSYSRYKVEKEVEQIDLLSGKVIMTFKSVSEAARILGFASGGIAMVCRGERKSYKGYGWRYTKAYDLLKNKMRAVEQIDLKTKKAIMTFRNASEAAKYLDLGDTKISTAAGIILRCCKGVRTSYKGYGWRYKD